MCYSHINMRNTFNRTLDRVSPLISKTNQYAIRAVLYVAQQQHDAHVRAFEIAEGLGLPANYLSKILHALARAGVLVSERGPRGGFRLARPPAELSLADVMAPFDPVEEQRGCLLGLGECSDETPCQLHEMWKRASDPMIDFFRETTIGDVMEKVEL